MARPASGGLRAVWEWRAFFAVAQVNTRSHMHLARNHPVSRAVTVIGLTLVILALGAILLPLSDSDAGPQDPGTTNSGAPAYSQHIAVDSLRKAPLPPESQQFMKRKRT